MADLTGGLLCICSFFPSFLDCIPLLSEFSLSTSSVGSIRLSEYSNLIEWSDRNVGGIKRMDEWMGVFR
jgi:hypothetical protein